MKINAIVRIVLFSLAILILGSILLGVTAYESFSFDKHSIRTDNERVSGEATQVNFAGKASDIHHLEIQWAAGSITIHPDSGSDQILISESVVSDAKSAMHITQSGNKLKIEYSNEDRIYIGFGNHSIESKDLVIYVPADWTCDSLEIEAAAADVKISGLTIRDMEFDGASGICTFDDCRIEKLNLNTASGDVDFTGTLEILDFDAMSARFTGTFLNVPSRIDVDSMSGDLDISLPEDCGFTLSLDALSGDFTSDFATSMQGDHHRFGDGRCRITVNAMSGDVYIRKHNHTNHHG